MKNDFDLVKHEFKPIYDKKSKILILGTMPSVKSRKENFYYMHPQNLFWKVLSKIFNTSFPMTIDDKIKMLLNNRIALWDVLKSCVISGSSDSTIKDPVPNDFSGILSNSKIDSIFTNGTRATSLYKKHCSEFTKIDSIYLPSTSPANIKYYTYEKIFDEWKKILYYINL